MIAWGRKCDSLQDRASNIGLPAQQIDIRIVNQGTGESLPPGEKGSLLVRGPETFLCYVGDKMGTADALESTVNDSLCWYRTKDLATVTHCGRLDVLLRLGESINKNNRMLGVEQIEIAIREAAEPEPVDCVVVPVDDPLLGQDAVAVIRADGEHEPHNQDLFDGVRKRIDPLHVPLCILNLKKDLGLIEYVLQAE